MCCEGLMVFVRRVERIAPLEQVPAGLTLSPIIYAAAVMAVLMTLSGSLASARAVIEERITAKTNPSSIRGLSGLLRERKGEWRGPERAKIISGMERTEERESSGGAEQINGAEQTEGIGGDSILRPTCLRGFFPCFFREGSRDPSACPKGVSPEQFDKSYHRIAVIPLFSFEVSSSGF